jgi:hypothetical protein
LNKGEEVAQAASTYLGEQRRRSTRLVQTSPVIIRGVDLLGQPFEERTAAQNLSFHGCLYASKHHLPKNTWITLEVPSGELRGDAMCVRARVAWIERPRTLRDLFQVGVELEKGTNMWGVSFPPSDWAGAEPSAAAVTTMSISAEIEPPAGEDVESKPAEEASLENYLQMAIAHTNRDFTTATEASETFSAESETLLGQLRQEFLAESKKMLAEARATADDVVTQRANELRKDFASQQEASTEALHKKWMDELEHGKVGTKEEIASAVAENVAAQLAGFQEQVRGALTSEWADKLSHAQTERSQWESELQALREEMRASAETTLQRSDECFNGKLMDIRRELESSLAAKAAMSAGETENATAEIAELMRSQLLTETDNARTQWSELLESSLDSAAQRLNERLTGASQELLHRTEQELAKRLAEVQRESGLATETSRAALTELKVALDAEVVQAKTALGEIEHTAGRFSEYSRQLDAASHDSLSELRQKLETSVVQHCEQLDKHATELEGKFSARAAQLLEGMSREAVARSAQEIGATVASGLERAAKAAEDLAAREEQAEGILRIHRERLRQASEQVQREGATHLAGGLVKLQRDLDEVRSQALAEWDVELAAHGSQATEEASAALAKETGRQLVEADAQLLVQAQQAVDSAQDRMNKGLHVIAGKFRSEFGEIEASQLALTREKLASAAQEQLDSAKNEFTRAAEKAASTFGEVIEEAAETALQAFSAASDVRVGDARARLVTEAESLVQGLESRVQSSIEGFQEHLNIKAEQALQRASETLAHQFELALGRFREQGEASLADWSVNQAALSEQALGKYDEQLRAASSSWVEATLERLDGRSEERVRTAVRATESAVRDACADIFDSVAQAMKTQLQGPLEIRHATPSEAANPQEHRASA